MQRFQVPYNLKEIPEVQEYLRDAFEQSKNRTDLQDLYRRRYDFCSSLREITSESSIACWSSPSDLQTNRHLATCVNFSSGQHAPKHQWSLQHKITSVCLRQADGRTSPPSSPFDLFFRIADGHLIRLRYVISAVRLISANLLAVPCNCLRS